MAESSPPSVLPLAAKLKHIQTATPTNHRLSQLSFAPLLDQRFVIPATGVCDSRNWVRLSLTQHKYAPMPYFSEKPAISASLPLHSGLDELHGHGCDEEHEQTEQQHV